MSVRCTSQWHIRTPSHNIACIVPVATFRSICLISPYLRTRWRQIGIPVIEAKRYATHKVQEPCTPCIAKHGHSWNYGKASITVWTIFGSCIKHRCGNDFRGFIPIGTNETAKATGFFVFTRFFRVFYNSFPRL